MARAVFGLLRFHPHRRRVFRDMAPELCVRLFVTGFAMKGDRKMRATKLRHVRGDPVMNPRYHEGMRLRRPRPQWN